MIDRGTTEKQQKILDVIRAFTSEMGYPPSVREIGERVGLSSSSTVQSHLKTLERRGLLRRDPTKPRALVPSDLVLGSAASVDRPESVTLPIVGRVAAGVPITAAENLEDTFILPAGFVRRSGAFMLRVKGDSMVDAAILDGDLIVVDPRPTAENGEIVVAMIDGEATVKRFFRERAASGCNRRIVRWRQSTPTMSPSSDASRPSSDASDSARHQLDRILNGRTIAPKIREAAERAVPRLAQTDSRRPAIRMRVIEAFLAEGIAESDLAGSTGYGYDDPARDRYESLLARVLRAERVLARLSLVSGTHAIVAALGSPGCRPAHAAVCERRAVRHAALRARRRAVRAGNPRRDLR